MTTVRFAQLAREVIRSDDSTPLRLSMMVRENVGSRAVGLNVARVALLSREVVGHVPNADQKLRCAMIWREIIRSEDVAPVPPPTGVEVGSGSTPSEMCDFHYPLPEIVNDATLNAEYPIHPRIIRAVQPSRVITVTEPAYLRIVVAGNEIEEVTTPETSLHALALAINPEKTLALSVERRS